MKASVQIYSRPDCGYCLLAKKLFDRKGIAYDEIDLAAEEGRVGEMVERSGGRMSFPQIFIRGRHIGCYSEVAALDLRGALDLLLEAA